MINVSLAYVTLATRTAVLEDGTTCEVTDMFDEDGEQTEDVGEVVSAVIKVSDEHWISVYLPRFTPVTLHLMPRTTLPTKVT